MPTLVQSPFTSYYGYFYFPIGHPGKWSFDFADFGRNVIGQGTQELGWPVRPWRDNVFTRGWERIQVWMNGIPVSTSLRVIPYPTSNRLLGTLWPVEWKLERPMIGGAERSSGGTWGEEWRVREVDVYDSSGVLSDSGWFLYDLRKVERGRFLAYWELPSGIVTRTA